MKNLISFATLTSAATVLLVSGSAFATGMENPETNHASYWGNNCTKTEISGDVKTYTVSDSGVTKVIVKGGTGYVVYEDGIFTNLTAPKNPKNNTTYGISHVIVCKGTVNPVDPQEPTKPEEPGKPGEPTKPTTPTTPTTPQGGKGSTTQTPAELPKTGADNDLATYFTIATGVSILVALVGYKGALGFITSRLS